MLKIPVLLHFHGTLVNSVSHWPGGPQQQQKKSFTTQRSMLNHWSSISSVLLLHICLILFNCYLIILTQIFTFVSSSCLFESSFRIPPYVSDCPFNNLAFIKWDVLCCTHEKHAKENTGCLFYLWNREYYKRRAKRKMGTTFLLLELQPGGTSIIAKKIVPGFLYHPSWSAPFLKSKETCCLY